MRGEHRRVNGMGEGTIPVESMMVVLDTIIMIIIVIIILLVKIIEMDIVEKRMGEEEGIGPPVIMPIIVIHRIIIILVMDGMIEGEVMIGEVCMRGEDMSIVMIVLEIVIDMVRGDMVEKSVIDLIGSRVKEAIGRRIEERGDQELVLVTEAIDMSLHHRHHLIVIPIVDVRPSVMTKEKEGGDSPNVLVTLNPEIILLVRRMVGGMKVVDMNVVKGGITSRGRMSVVEWRMVRVGFTGSLREMCLRVRIMLMQQHLHDAVRVGWQRHDSRVRLELLLLPHAVVVKLRHPWFYFGMKSLLLLQLERMLFLKLAGKNRTKRMWN
jgi:hypothetical protein